MFPRVTGDDRRVHCQSDRRGVSRGTHGLSLVPFPDCQRPPPSLLLSALRSSYRDLSPDPQALRGVPPVCDLGLPGPPHSGSFNLSVLCPFRPPSPFYPFPGLHPSDRGPTRRSPSHVITSLLPTRPLYSSPGVYYVTGPKGTDS